MKNTCNKIILILFLFTSVIMQAQSAKSFPELIIGSYDGTGTLFGHKAIFTMTWENELNDKFTRLTFENRFRDKSNNERIMKAHAYYAFGQSKGYWFDSRGVMLPLKLEIEGNSMTVFWGNEATERGKTIYLIKDSTKVSIQDFVYRDSTYVHFGKAFYNRIEKLKGH